MAAHFSYSLTVQLEYTNHLMQFFKLFSYYAGIILNAFSDLLCSKLCWHNWLVPSDRSILKVSVPENWCYNAFMHVNYKIVVKSDEYIRV